MTFFISNVEYKLDKMNGIDADSGTKNFDFDDFFKDLKKAPPLKRTNGGIMRYLINQKIV